MFGQPLLEQQGDENLLRLTAERSLAVVQDNVARQLHRQRASALLTLVGADVGDGGGENPVDAHAEM